MRYKRLSTQKANRILRRFCPGVTATVVAELAGVNRRTANSYYNEIKEKILRETPTDNGEFEADESYFGARRIRGKRGRGAAGKIPVFGLLKRGGRVFVKVVENCSREELLPIMMSCNIHKKEYIDCNKEKVKVYRFDN